MTSKGYQAIILAGGKGARLRPYTTSFPKPLMPIDDVPILEIVLRQLSRHGFKRIIIATGHLGEMIRLFCGNGDKWGLTIEYVHESQPLGTAGALGLIRDRLDDNFLVMNGDLLTTLNYGNGLRAHVQQGSPATVCVYAREVHIDFGVIEVGSDGSLCGYREKPTLRYDVSMGINFFSNQITRLILEGERLDIPDLIARLRDAGSKVSCYRESCYWLDIGRADDYSIATDEFIRRRSEFVGDDV